MRYEVRADLRFEQIEDEIVVLDASGGTVHSLDGEAAEALRLVLVDESVPAQLEGAVDGLREAGILEQPAGWSRRKALLAGGVGAATVATGVFSMALPAAALASSCQTVEDGALPLDASMATQTFDMAGSYRLQIGRLNGETTGMVTVQLWGGGGAGGNGGGSTSGGGGGGGGFTSATLTVSACGVYDVIVGAGGAVAATMVAGAQGGDGTPSTISGPIIATTSAGAGMGGMGSSTSGGGAGGTGTFAGGMGGNGLEGVFIFQTGGGGGGGSAGTTVVGMAGSVGNFGSGGVGGAGGVTGGALGATGGYTSDATSAGAPGAGGGGGGSLNQGQPSAGAPGRVTVSLVP